MPPTDLESPPDAIPRSSLEYDRSSTHITRRQFRIFLWLIFINTIIFASSVFGPGAGFFRSAWENYQNKRQIKKQSEQQDVFLHQAGTYTAPADDVIYEEDPAEAAKLLNSSSGYTVIEMQEYRGGQGGLFGNSKRPDPEWQLPVLRTEPPIVSQLRSKFRIHTQERLGTILLHTLKTPRGEDRLVWITVYGAQPILTTGTDNSTTTTTYLAYTRRSIAAFVIEKTDTGNSVPVIDVASHHVTLLPETPNLQTRFTFTKADNSETGKIVFDAKGCFRFYAAQLDPQNPSHFLIDYALDGQRNTIDGYIKDDDSIIFTPRSGRIVTERPDGKIWNPLATPAAGPSN